MLRATLGRPRLFCYLRHLPSSFKIYRTMSYLDNIRTFVRVYELGSMSAAGRVSGRRGGGKLPGNRALRNVRPAAGGEARKPALASKNSPR
uniref:Uncharacterized protein n=1 Tax=Alloyangia mangrovi TaxID=1779329 RepID=A0A2A3JRH0_9RHOB